MEKGGKGRNKRREFLSYRCYKNWRCPRHKRKGKEKKKKGRHEKIRRVLFPLKLRKELFRREPSLGEGRKGGGHVPTHSGDSVSVGRGMRSDFALYCFLLTENCRVRREKKEKIDKRSFPFFYSTLIGGRGKGADRYSRQFFSPNQVSPRGKREKGKKKKKF